MRQITFQNVLKEDSVPMARLGELAQTEDGREWRYVKFNEAFGTKGMIATRIANTDVDTVSSSTDGDSNITKVTEASAGWTVGQFENAWLLVDDGTGEGQFAKVKTNSADTLNLYTDYALTTALDVADSDIVLARPYLAEKSAITVLNQILLGVAQITTTANYYGWVQIRGYGGVLVGDVITANEQITPGDDTEGTGINVGSGETIDDASTVGRCVVANTTADKACLADIIIY